MKQSRMEEILRDYTAGKLDAQQANQELKKMGAPVRLQPGRNEITEAEQQAIPGLMTAGWACRKATFP